MSSGRFNEQLKSKPPRRMTQGALITLLISCIAWPVYADSNEAGFFLSPILSCRSGNAKIALVSRIYRNPLKPVTKIFDLRASGRVNRQLYSWTAKVNALRSVSKGQKKENPPIAPIVISLKKNQLEGDLGELTLPSISIRSAENDPKNISLLLNFQPKSKSPEEWTRFENCQAEEGWQYLLDAL